MNSGVYLVARRQFIENENDNVNENGEEEGGFDLLENEENYVEVLEFTHDRQEPGTLFNLNELHAVGTMLSESKPSQLTYINPITQVVFIFLLFDFFLYLFFIHFFYSFFFLPNFKNKKNTNKRN